MSENNRFKKRIKDLKISLHYQQQIQPNLIDQMTIYQCNECGKTFINNEYLNSHLKRRHNIDQNIDKENIQDSDENTRHTTPEHEKYRTETDRLQSEIKVLKEKLNNTERYFNPHGDQSPDHGTVKIQKSPMYSTESLKDVKQLQKQFDDLKNMVQTELNTIRAQRLANETSSQENLLRKVFEKLENKSELQQAPSIPQTIQNERRDNYIQTDDDLFENISKPTSVVPVEQQNLNPTDSGNLMKRQVYQKKDERSKSFLHNVDELSTEREEKMPNLNLVTENVEKKMEAKTKKEIEKLGEELNKKVNIFKQSTFNQKFLCGISISGVSNAAYGGYMSTLGDYDISHYFLFLTDKNVADSCTR